MFEKLLANLPYNPSLVNQISFYARRMRREESLRRIGLVFVVMAFMVQFFAFISPPQSTSAYSSSDMINGGIASRADAVAACRHNVKNYGDALWNFHITCDNVANASTTWINSNDYNGNLFSLSWLPYGARNPNSGKPTDETPLNLAKVSETIYARRLTSADHLYPYSKYQVLKVTNANGHTFWIMFGCGNLVSVGVPQPAPICRMNGNIYYQGAPECNPPAKCPYNPAILASSAQCFKQCPYNTSISIDSAACTVCPYNNKITKSDSKCIKPCALKPSIAASSPQCKACAYDHSILASDKKCVKPCPYNSSLPADSAACKPCTDSLSSSDAVACIVERKTAANSTQNIANADGSTAQPNDVIIYTLFADNKGKATVKNFVMQENLNDVLDYADVTDLGGGKLSSTGTVSWPAADVKAGATLTHKLTVRIKNPVPATTPPAGDPNHFDHIMTNVYGNAVNINLPTPPIENVVATPTEQLPNTGPGASLILAAAIVVVAGYFFARARLLVDESMLAVQETTAGRL